MAEQVPAPPRQGVWTVERLRATRFAPAHGGVFRASGRGGRASGYAGRGDADLNPGLRHQCPVVPAAVLVPLVPRDEGMTILLTRRAVALDDHAGEMSFPGGRVEKADRDAEATAVREAEEELALPRARVEILGRLDDYLTTTGFRVSPVVAIARPPFELTPDAREVAEVFELPLDVILDPARHERHTQGEGKAARSYYAFRHEGRFIWGATAGMLINLYEVLTRS